MGRNDFKHVTGTDAQADKHTAMHMVAAAAGAAIIAFGTGAAVQPANATTERADSCATGNQPRTLEVSKIIGQSDLAHVQTDQVVGDFSFTQNELSSVEDIVGTFRKTTSVLCSSTYKQVEDTANWQVEVGGDVLHEFSASLAELAPEHATSSIITCACSNNGAGGNAIINAKATGITIASLAAQAGILPDVNAVRFTAADGTVSTLPLTYLITHGALIAYSLNDEDLSQSVGSANQLWIDASAGKYFTRDIQSVEFLALDEVPAEPSLETTDYEYANRPNVGMQIGE